MKIAIFVHGGKVDGTVPTTHFLLRLEAALGYIQSHQQDDVTVLVSGRWTSVTEEYAITEAEAGKRWILDKCPDAHVIKEDISVELIGNFAFSKPLLAALAPDEVIIPTSLVLQSRIELLADRIFAGDLPYHLDYITDDLADNGMMLEREAQAVTLFNTVFADVTRGDDAGFRTRLLYGTPYYFKSVIDDKTFFDRYWEGGFDHYVNSRRSYRPDWRPDSKA